MCGSFRVSPAVLLNGRGVYSREEGLDGFRDSVAAAERSDDSCLCCRVLLLRALGCRLESARILGPFGYVAPVGVRCQDCVRVCRFAFACLSDELRVA